MMMKTKNRILPLVAALFVTPLLAALPTRNQLVQTNGIKNYSDYQTALKQLQTAGFKDPAWFAFWQSYVADPSTLSSPSYYLRIRSEVTDSNYTSFENVKRVMTIMPKAKFNAMFPSSTATGHKELAYTKLDGNDYAKPGSAGGSTVYWHSTTSGISPQRYTDDLFSYENFLKAVALMPAYCGDYSDYPDPDVQPILAKNADLIARKMLAATFAHAVQETSDSGVADSSGQPTMKSKLKGTFDSVIENGPPLCPDANGIFAYNTGYFSPLTTTGTQNNGAPVLHAYAGRGIKQLTYPTNYSNSSLLLFGDLRLLAYPELLEEPGVLGFLSAIAYALIPKGGNPSLAEVMDGSFSRKLDALVADPTVAANPDFQTFRSTYELEFPLTVLLVNGGPECDQNTGIKGNSLLTATEKQQTMDANNNNTKIRLEAYNYFVQTQDLLNHVSSGGVTALPPSFDTTPVTTPVKANKTEGDRSTMDCTQYLPPSSASYENDYYNLTGNLDSCLNLMVGALNKAPATTVDTKKILADPNTQKLSSADFTDAALATRTAWPNAIYNGGYIVVNGKDIYQATLPAGKTVATQVSDFVPVGGGGGTPWNGMFVRQMYYGKDWNGNIGISADSSLMPIYGGAPVKSLVEQGN